MGHHCSYICSICLFTDDSLLGCHPGGPQSLADIAGLGAEGDLHQMQ